MGARGRVRPDPRIRRQPLPGMLGEIERLVGYNAALRFACAFGGQELYLPVVCPREHRVARAIGWSAARVVCEHLGGAGPLANGGWAIPTAEIEIKWNEARRLRLEGASRNAIVAELRRRFGVCTSVSSVGKLIQGLPKPVAEAADEAPASRTLPDPITLFEWRARQRRRLHDGAA